jgi:hypothetical protein
MSQLKDITGERFGKWTVLSRAENNKEGRAVWVCRCDCGTVRKVIGKTLISGKSSCCGCTRKENASKASSRSNTKHGMRKTRLYTIWQSMKGRTKYPSTNSYERYGGRGIKVCEEWEKDFTAFAQWALSNGYSDELTLDRIDPDGNYEPSNCRWATWSQQARNKCKRG